MKSIKITVSDLEKPYQELEEKIKAKLGEPGMQAKVFKKLGIDRTQLSNFKNGRKKFSKKRLLKIAAALDIFKIEFDFDNIEYK